MSNLPTEDQLRALVDTFYGRARAHPSLGPLFAATVPDWDHHLAIVQNFWSHALLGTARYKGHPYPVHIGLPIQREHFGMWLDLFRVAAKETLPEVAAKAAIAKAEHMAESFRAGLFPFDPVPSHDLPPVTGRHPGS